jgi:3-hydroxyisobutyrate dehydrogenase-like beta-hydroxyacid dehydrogenase
MLLDCLEEEPVVSAKSTQVAVIGLGAMGTALAGALLRSGAEVRVWNRTADKCHPLHDQGAIACATAADAISGSEIVVVCVSTYLAWRSLVDQQNLGQTLADRTIIQFTTGTLDHVREHENWVGQCGAHLIDGSIMCFPSQIGTDEATLLVAGAQPVFDSCRDILTVLAPNICYLEDNMVAPVVLDMALLSGMLGMIVGTINGAALCRAGGVSLSHFTEQSRIGSSVMTGESLRICEAIETGDTKTTEASLQTWAAIPADLVDLASAFGTRTEYPAALRFVFQRALDSGLGDHDVSALVDVLGRD